MKKILFAIVSFCFSQTLLAQTFQYAIGGVATDVGKCIIKTTDGGYAITGSTYSYGVDSSDVYIIKLNSSGVIQWTRTVGGPSYDGGTSIIQTTDGGYAITGRTGYWTFGMYVIRLDGNGNLLWDKTINNVGISEQGYTIIQTYDGGFAVSGRSDASMIGTLGWVVKLSISGAIQWSKTVSGFLDGAYSIVQANDHGYVMAGATISAGAGGLDLYVVKLDSTGNLLWTRTAGGTGDEQVFPSSKIIKTSDGGYALNGFTTSFGAGSNDVYTVKLSSSGTLQWTRVVGGTGDDMGNAIAQTSDKGYVIAGSTTSFGAGNNDAYEIKLDSNGVLQWTRTIGGSGEEAGYGIVQTSGGGYLLTGSTTSYGSGNGDVYLVKSDASGIPCGTYGSGGTSTTGGSGGNGGGLGGSAFPVSIPGPGSAGSGGTRSIICDCNISTTISHTGPLNFCNGGSVLLQTATGPGLSYQWKKNGIPISGAVLSSYTATTSGTYKVVVTNTSAGCSKTTPTGTVVTAYSNPTAVLTATGSTTFCAGDSVKLSTNYSVNYTYIWKRNNVNISGAILNKYYPKTAGSYKVKATNTNGCTTISNAITVSVPCRGDNISGENNEPFELSVYPNPSNGIININNSSPDEKIISAQLSDVMGKILPIDITMKNMEGAGDQINCTTCPNGIYMLSLYSNFGNVVKKKIVILK